MNNYPYIKKARDFMKANNINYLLINSTNEFLVEYNSLEKNSRYFLTGFSGSAGDALVTEKDVFLFVDGRYHTQADLEVNHEEINVVKLQIGDNCLDEMLKKMDTDSVIGVCSKKNSQLRYENLNKKLTEKNISIKLFDFDILENPIEDKPQKLTKIDITLSGKSTQEKLKDLSKNLNDDEAIVITNLEELSYLYNLRNFEKENSCSIEGKAIITKTDNILFINENLNEFENYIKNNQKINHFFVNKNSITAYDYSLLKDKAKAMELSPIRNTKAIKTDAEIKHYIEAFKNTDRALTATRQFIEENENISEFDIKNELESNFKKFGAVGQSFTSIVAKDSNSALAHYSKSSKDEILKNGSLVLIDCGGYFEGGLATDITRVFVKGEPSELQKKVYTTVLKAFLAAFNTTNTNCGYVIDKIARDFLNENAPEGFLFNHGLGHGIGVSVHEGPPRLSTSGDDTLFPLEDNMCFTIEPGLYKQGYFGVRLENSCYMKDGKIKSFSNMCYEKKLIDFSMLSEQEKLWLNSFEVK